MNVIDNTTSGFGGPIVPSGGTISLPLDLILTDLGSSYSGTFRPGTVNGLIPSNYQGITGISKTGTLYVILTVAMTNAAPTTATFSTTGSIPPSTSPSKGVPPPSVIVLTHMVVDGEVLRVLGMGNVSLKCVASFETDKTGVIAPGTRTTDVWYNYDLNTSA